MFCASAVVERMGRCLGLKQIMRCNRPRPVIKTVGHSRQSMIYRWNSVVRPGMGMKSGTSMTFAVRQSAERMAQGGKGGSIL